MSSTSRVDQPDSFRLHLSLSATSRTRRRSRRSRQCGGECQQRLCLDGGLECTLDSRDVRWGWHWKRDRACTRWTQNTSSSARTGSHDHCRTDIHRQSERRRSVHLRHLAHFRIVPAAWGRRQHHRHGAGGVRLDGCQPRLLDHHHVRCIRHWQRPRHLLNRAVPRSTAQSPRLNHHRDIHVIGATVALASGVLSDRQRVFERHGERHLPETRSEDVRQVTEEIPSRAEVEARGVERPTRHTPLVMPGLIGHGLEMAGPFSCDARFRACSISREPGE